MTEREDFIWKHGVTRWGLTTAVGGGLLITWRHFGTLSSKPALIYLIVWLIVGIPSFSLAGCLWGWIMWGTVRDPDDARRGR
jgi:hypothetical protein